MCGHGIIGLTTILLETHLLRKLNLRSKNHIKFDTPAGQVIAYPKRVDKKTFRPSTVVFHNVPSFVHRRDFKVKLSNVHPGGKDIVVHLDVVFGGAYYAFVEVGSKLNPVRPVKKHRSFWSRLHQQTSAPALLLTL